VITNVPTCQDFSQHAIMFLNLAWDTVFELVRNHRIMEEQCGGYDDEGLMSEKYWEAAKRPLSVAHALAQQGAELALKSEIAAASPFLLICSSASEWPRGCDKSDTPFADFRTLDAQDLIRACNAVRSLPLSEKFVRTFDKFRKQRNALFHTVDERLEFSVQEVVRYILGTAQIICPSKWTDLRIEYIEQNPLPQADPAYGGLWFRVCVEMDDMISLLTRGELLEWFGFDKQQRRYICPKCYEAWGDDSEYEDPKSWPATAQLRPNKPDATQVYCFVCGSNIKVTREKCPYESGCNGNVLHAGDWARCLTCGQS